MMFGKRRVSEGQRFSFLHSFQYETLHAKRKFDVPTELNVFSSSWHCAPVIHQRKQLLTTESNYAGLTTKTGSENKTPRSIDLRTFAMCTGSLNLTLQIQEKKAYISYALGYALSQTVLCQLI